MAPTKRRPGTLMEKIEIAKDFDEELDLVPVVKKLEGEILTVAEQNEVMVRALRDIFDIYMVFDDPKAEDFGLIAQRALKKVGRM